MSPYLAKIKLHLSRKTSVINVATAAAILCQSYSLSLKSAAHSDLYLEISYPIILSLSPSSSCSTHSLPSVYPGGCRREAKFFGLLNLDVQPTINTGRLKHGLSDTMAIIAAPASAVCNEIFQLVLDLYFSSLSIYVYIRLFSRLSTTHERAYREKLQFLLGDRRERERESEEEEGRNERSLRFSHIQLGNSYIPAPQKERKSLETPGKKEPRRQRKIAGASASFE